MAFEPPTTGAATPAAGKTVELITGDSRVELARFADATFDAITSDPPHGIGLASWDVLPEIEHLAELLRVLKPGGRLLFIADDRTCHRLGARLEEAGFEIEGMCAWVYATGRPRTVSQPRPAFAPILVARRKVALLGCTNVRRGHPRVLSRLFDQHGATSGGLCCNTNSAGTRKWIEHQAAGGHVEAHHMRPQRDGLRRDVSG